MASIPFQFKDSQGFITATNVIERIWVENSDQESFMNRS